MMFTATNALVTDQLGNEHRIQIFLLYCKLVKISRCFFLLNDWLDCLHYKLGLQAMLLIYITWFTRNVS